MKRLIINIPDETDTEELLALLNTATHATLVEEILPADLRYRVTWAIKLGRSNSVRGQQWVAAEDAEALRRLQKEEPTYAVSMGELAGKHSEVFAEMSEMTVADQPQVPGEEFGPDPLEQITSNLLDALEEYDADHEYTLAELIHAYLDEKAA